MNGHMYVFFEVKLSYQDLGGSSIKKWLFFKKVVS